MTTLAFSNLFQTNSFWKLFLKVLKNKHSSYSKETIKDPSPLLRMQSLYKIIKFTIYVVKCNINKTNPILSDFPCQKLDNSHD